jgi:hypothetical protein
MSVHVVSKESGLLRLTSTSYGLHKLEGKTIVLNISNTLQNLFTWDNSITNIVDSKLCTGVYGDSEIFLIK